MEKVVLGIDIAKKNFDVVLWQAGQQVHRSFANRGEGFEQLSHWLQKQGG